MKKKKAFTLAEVLITLAVIGVITALALPALNNAVQKNKVGPTLRKFVSTMEEANEHIMSDNDADKISVVTNDIETYYTELKKYVDGSFDMKKSVAGKCYYYNGKTPSAGLFSTNGVFTLKDGSELYMKKTAVNANQNTSFKGQMAYWLYDINGFDNKPNRYGKDIFAFALDNGGTLIPYGGELYNKAYGVAEEGKELIPIWKQTEGDNSCSDSGTIKNGESCAGSIADNGWKVIYKY